MPENRIPLTYEEAISAMVVDCEHLVDEKNSPDRCHYKWKNDSIVSADGYYHDSEDYLDEIPQLYRANANAITKTIIHKAVEFAALKHKNQKRKGKNTPYIYHPLAVFDILRKNKCSENVLIAGVLHDTLEDTETTPEEILNNFGQEILDIVKQESEDKSKTWKERKQTTIDHLENASLEVKLVCCADKLANLKEMAIDMATTNNFWDRFNASKEDIEWYYRGVASKLTDLSNYEMYNELLGYINNVVFEK